MGIIKRFEDLEIWKLSRELFKEIYHIIESIHFKNNFKLYNQINGSLGNIK
ncbi:four helix bundle protein [Chryseobacterium indologenes]|uniref:four helix bundle protein n=1 Tax=uncultured Chryseobacterium sp. TaxID=259322 RepID=UPI0032048EE4